MTRLNSRDKTIVRKSATQSVLEKTDRILYNNSPIKVEIIDSSIPAPAYTDGSTIWLNLNHDPLNTAINMGFSQKDVMITSGLNYHELAHCLFTPRFTTPLMKRVVSEGMTYTVNILEDQAAETRFVKLYQPSHRYFTALVSNFMMKNSQYVESNYVLVAGRLFLPKKLRELFKDRFVKPSIIDDVDALVAKYKTLVYPEDSEEMYRVIKDFHNLINDVNHTGASELRHDVLDTGEHDRQKTKETNEQEEFQPQELDDEESSEPDDGDEDDEGEGSSVPTESEAEDGDDQESAEGEPEEGEEPTDKDAGGSSSSGEPQAPTDEEVQDALEDAIESTLDEIGQELDDRIKNIRHEERNYSIQLTHMSHTEEDPSPELVNTVTRCQDEFRRVQVQHTPGWNPRQKTGKLNPRQYAKAIQGDENVFKRWREGVHDALDFEVVFLLDQSGSMQGKINTASRSLWALKRTFEELDGTVSVIGFEQETALLSQRGDRARQDKVPLYPALGGTYVSDAMQEAVRIHGTSVKKLCLTVVISDGRFHDFEIAKQVVKDSMNTPIAFIGIQMNTNEWINVPNVIHTQKIEDPSELVDVVKNIALRLSDEHINRKGYA